jgi:phage shock protein PspC (stress-responsive transcriptional regulator)
MKSLRRLPADRKIAGVCAGLGDYFDIDPAFVRLIFLAAFFFGGAGLLAYLVMWVMVPAVPGVSVAAPARLHLSVTDRKLAGVCGGLGAFFGLDPVLFRAGFVVLALAWGFGLPLYAAFWLVMPRAQPARALPDEPPVGTR